MGDKYYTKRTFLNEVNMLQSRRKSISVDVWGVIVWGDNTVVIQSMTNTPTKDTQATTDQIIELADAGSQIVRITINDDASAEAVPEIFALMKKRGCSVPIVGDFHYNGHILLEKYPQMAKLIAKYRINPGNVGKGERQDENFFKIIDCAIKYNKPVRIGVNGGSLDEELLSKNMDENSKLTEPLSAEEVYVNTMVESGVISAQKAVERWLPKEKIIISVKLSHLQSMVDAYQKISGLCEYPLHLGLTEAGGNMKGIVSSSAALAILLQQGIGDTIRVSLTPEIWSPRSKEVEVCKNLLQSLWLKSFSPQVVSCPGCGRTSSDKFQFLAKYIEDQIKKHLPKWKQKYTGFEDIHIAVMGCIVNGIGEARNADIGIFIPGDFENPTLQIYVKWERYMEIKSKTIGEVGKIFFKEIETYLDTNFQK